MKRKRAAVLWTGGKDSTLALYDSVLTGYDVVNLVTFAPVGDGFRAHPLGFMFQQAEALGLSHSVISIRKPFEKSYKDAICSLKDQNGIDVLVTGDISEVEGQPNWIRECSKPFHMEVHTPLWHVDRTTLMKRLLSSGFKVIFSCVKEPWFTEAWLGSPLNQNSFESLIEMAHDSGLDICGENGEYHTLVLDGPIFKKRIHIAFSSACKEASLMYLDIKRIELCDKGLS